LFVFSLSSQSPPNHLTSLLTDFFFLGCYRLFLAPRTPQNHNLRKLKLRLCLAEVERTIFNALVCLPDKDQLTTDMPPPPSHTDESPPTDHETSQVAPLSSSSCLSQHRSSKAQLMDGLIYFEIFRFLDLLKPMFLSSSHLRYHNSKRWTPMSMLFTPTSSGGGDGDDDCHQCAMSLSGIGVRLDNEFDGIRRDLLDLLNPKIAYRIKLEYLKRMRFTHKSLS
jgi:hypothetical protein